LEETVLPQAIRGVKFVGYLQVDANGFIPPNQQLHVIFFQSIILILFLCNKFHYQTEPLFKTQVGKSLIACKYFNIKKVAATK
jgi:hypothetical protein